MGAILAPIVIGTLVAIDLSLRQNFMAIAIPAIAIGLVKHARSASAHGRAQRPAAKLRKESPFS